MRVELVSHIGRLDPRFSTNGISHENLEMHIHRRPHDAVFRIVCGRKRWLNGSVYVMHSMQLFCPTNFTPLTVHSLISYMLVNA